MVSFYSPIVLLTFIATAAHCASLRGVDRFVQSELILLPTPSTASNNKDNGAHQQNVKVDSVPAGEALDLFYRYGFFSLSVRVVPRDDPASWIIREPTADIFQNANKIATVNKPHFDQNLEVSLCEDEAELMQAFFKGFSADGIEESHKLYTGSWHKSTKSKYLGLSKSSFESGDSSFVLLKLRKTRYSISTERDEDLRLNDDVAAAAASIKVGDKDGVMDFVRKFGSHYVSKVDVGDVVYQVYALTPEQFSALKSSRPTTLSVLASHLQPWAVKEAGKPLAASGDRDVIAFLQDELIAPATGSSPSLLALLERPALLAELETLTDLTEAVTGLRFASLRQFVPDVVTRDFYDGVLTTNAALWQANI